MVRIQKPVTHPDSFAIQDGDITGPKEIANYCNDIYTNIGPYLAKAIKQSNCDPITYIGEPSEVQMFSKPVQGKELLGA